MEYDNERKDLETIDVSNLRNTKNMSIEEAENVLNKLIQDGWLQKSGHKIWYGVRTLLDLRMYLQEQFDIDIYALT